MLVAPPFSGSENYVGARCCIRRNHILIGSLRAHERKGQKINLKGQAVIAVLAEN